VQALYRQRWPTPQQWHALHAHAADGRIKQLVTWRLLRCGANAAPVPPGSYVPLAVEGRPTNMPSPSRASTSARRCWWWPRA
jgi:hypothetical protein